MNLRRMQLFYKRKYFTQIQFQVNGSKRHQQANIFYEFAFGVNLIYSTVDRFPFEDLTKIKLQSDYLFVHQPESYKNFNLNDFA